MIPLRLWIMLAAVVAVLCLCVWALHFAYQAGRLAEQAAFLDRINKENENAGNVAEKWRGHLRRCFDAGGVFNFETGSCDR